MMRQAYIQNIFNSTILLGPWTMDMFKAIVSIYKSLLVLNLSHI